VRVITGSTTSSNEDEDVYDSNSTTTTTSSSRKVSKSSTIIPVTSSTSTSTSAGASQFLLFEVRDESIGLSPRAYSELFQAFSHTRTLTGDTGLGLHALGASAEAHPHTTVHGSLDRQSSQLDPFIHVKLTVLTCRP
jgi:hypothetical protein